MDRTVQVAVQRATSAMRGADPIVRIEKTGTFIKHTSGGAGSDGDDFELAEVMRVDPEADEGTQKRLQRARDREWYDISS